MSGIYIPNMEMPKNCYECLVRNQGFSGDGMKCGKTGSVLSWYDGNRKRMDDCPLVPAADARPVVRGKWIEHNYDPEYLSCDFSCSECNVYLEEYYFGEGQWPGKTDHYFCPNCGADMREES